MEHHSWYVHDAPLADKMSIVMDTDPGELWKRLLGDKGPGFSKVPGLPTDPSLN